MPQLCARNSDMILTDDLIEKCSNHHTDACEKGVKTDVMVEPCPFIYNNINNYASIPNKLGLVI